MATATSNGHHTLEELKGSMSIPEYQARQGREPRRVGGELYYHCTIHEDGRRGNLRYNESKGTWFCDVCGHGGDLVELVGRELYRDVWNNRNAEQVRAVAHRLSDVAGIPTRQRPQKQAPSQKAQPRPADLQITDVYAYHNAEGAVVFEKVRYAFIDEDGKPAKTFKVRRKVRDRYIYNLEGVEGKPLFQLPDLLAADPFEPVDITAGEKDAARLKSLNRVAVTNYGGEGNWDSSSNRYLEGRDLIIWEDNDEAGRKRTAMLLDELEPIAGTIKVVRPSDLPGLADVEKGDVSDWLDMGHGAEELHAIVEYIQPEPSRALAGWLTLDDLATLPDLEALIDGVLFTDSLGLIFSPTGTGKTFVVTDMAMSIAAGIDWHGNSTRAGMVAYIVAEGAKGMKLRAPAWVERRGVSPRDWIRFYPAPLPMLNMDTVTRLIAQLSAMPEKPALVVIDTFAWCFDGEENSNTDMSSYVKACDLIRQATGACVLTVHHTGAAGDRERGGTALKAAMDTAITIANKGGDITIKCDKQKDGAAPFADIKLRLVPTEDGRTCTVEPLGVVKCAAGVQKLRPSERSVLETLASDEFIAGCTPSALYTKLGMPRRTAMEALKTLMGRGLVTQVDTGEYLITAGGMEVCNGVQ